ncbi:NADH-quinone oxidoreductase subunit L [Methylocystis rosea]|uniref:NADH-quinone oxidoreductase subunit L n=1 Tax=Methylocystis rosea TaxID=173366 RepID=UPI0003A06BAD|nr:NADH-quinone oxidoreductase subunit L [Methylocystis rosea]
MVQLASWSVLLAPLSLAWVGMTPSGQANAAPDQMARRTLLAASMALAVALCATAIVALHGPLVSVTLGVSGVGIGVYVDALSATMLVLVSFIGLIVLYYSRNYLDGDPNHGRFLKFIALTLAAVLAAVISGNLVQLIAALIATSIGLNKLLLFCGERPAAQLAAKKKFIASRIADLCLIGAATLLLSTFGTLEFSALLAQAKIVRAYDANVTTAAVLIVMAALLKSAQLPTHGWLIEVMETPTPVSALLHAGVINAGGFIVLRLADLVALSHGALHLLAVVGGATALFGSVVMLTQTSVKVSLAYSTVAQMGFMMVECGLGAFPAAILHIVAHSLYKAHAFLSSGSIIDLARASWTPSPGGQPHPERFGLALVATIAVAFVVSPLFGASFSEKPGALALAMILMMGLAHMVANAIDERPSGYVIGKTISLAALAAVAFFTLHEAAERLMASSLPAPMSIHGFVGYLIFASVILSFCAVTVFQNVIAWHAKEPVWQAAYVHLSQGLYLNTIANRLVLRFWRRRPPAVQPN